MEKKILKIKIGLSVLVLTVMVANSVKTTIFTNKWIKKNNAFMDTIEKRVSETLKK